MQWFTLITGTNKIGLLLISIMTCNFHLQPCKYKVTFSVKTIVYSVLFFFKYLKDFLYWNLREINEQFRWYYTSQLFLADLHREQTQNFFLKVICRKTVHKTFIKSHSSDRNQIRTRTFPLLCMSKLDGQWEHKHKYNFSECLDLWRNS